MLPVMKSPKRYDPAGRFPWRAAVDVPAGDGPGQRAVQVGDGEDHERSDRVALRRVDAGRGDVALERAPAVIPADRDDVDLLPRALPHIADVEQARPAVERESVRVAQTQREDLVGAGHADIRVVRRDPVVAFGVGREAVAVDVDAEDLAEQRVDVLGVVAGIIARAAVPLPDVEQAIGAELDRPAVVVGERLGDAQEEPLTRRVRDIRVPGVDSVLDDVVGVGLPGAGVVDVEPAVARELGVERQAQQALLPARLDPPVGRVRCRRGDVEEDAHRTAGLADQDPAALLDDEQPAAWRHARR